MPNLTIERLGAPILRAPAAAIEDINDQIRSFAKAMADALVQADGIGLAAPQVGMSAQLVVIGAMPETSEAPVALVNPVIRAASDVLVPYREGCLSIPGLSEVVVRPDAVEVEAITLDGRAWRAEASGRFARVLQHEIDHLRGVLFIDRLPPMLRRQVLDRYKKLSRGRARAQ